jgi:phage I-like protein
MIQETLSKIEAQIECAGTITPEAKEELRQLLGTLKAEVGEIAQTHAEQARTISGFAQVSAHEATREQKNPQLLKLSLEGLAASVGGFENSHPRLVAIVNRICTTLSNLGV